MCRGGGNPFLQAGVKTPHPFLEYIFDWTPSGPESVVEFRISLFFQHQAEGFFSPGRRDRCSCGSRGVRDGELQVPLCVPFPVHHVRHPRATWAEGLLNNQTCCLKLMAAKPMGRAGWLALDHARIQTCIGMFSLLCAVLLSCNERVIVAMAVLQMLLERSPYHSRDSLFGCQFLVKGCAEATSLKVPGNTYFFSNSPFFAEQQKYSRYCVPFAQGGKYCWHSFLV